MNTERFKVLEGRFKQSDAVRFDFSQTQHLQPDRRKIQTILLNWIQRVETPYDFDPISIINQACDPNSNQFSPSWTRWQCPSLTVRICETFPCPVEHFQYFCCYRRNTISRLCERIEYSFPERWRKTYIWNPANSRCRPLHQPVKYRLSSYQRFEFCP